MEESRKRTILSIDAIHADKLDASIADHGNAHAGLDLPSRVTAMHQINGEFCPPAAGLVETIGSGACPAGMHEATYLR